ncbi:hypothetical protein NL676_030937 [Syzygium grande]|nr:hypothetical protein NL676_030937 [Syzygium grande]
MAKRIISASLTHRVTCKQVSIAGTNSEAIRAYFTHAAHPSRAIARVAPMNLFGNASRIHLSSSTGSKSSSVMGDSPARSQIILRFASLQNNGAPASVVLAIGTGMS